MAIKDSFLAELQHEAKSTKKMLERVPENLSWKPHEKSMTLGGLATHLAEIYGWLTVTITTNELDFAKTPYTPFQPKSTLDIVNYFNETFDKAVETLSKATDAQLMENWTLRNGEQIYFTMPKIQVIRSWVINHLVHHRGQLSVYLRLLNVPLPGVYGPTADEQMMS